MADYKLSRRAVADLNDIWTYSASTWSADRADRYVGDVLDTASLLASGERNGRPVEKRENHLRYSVGSHFIIYRRAGTGIVVVRILHQRRDLPRHL